MVPPLLPVGNEDAIEPIVGALSKYDGEIIVSKVNNEKANVKIINE